MNIAEVVRDLRKRDPNTEQSYSERQMYQAALERLAREFAAIEDIDQDTAVSARRFNECRLAAGLPRSCLSRSFDLFSKRYSTI